MSGYTVCQADSAAAEGPFVAIWETNLNVPGDPRRQYRWHYLDGPTGAGSAFLLHHQGERGTSDIVGCCGLVRRTFALSGTPVSAALIGDFAVARGHRTVMPALVLQRAIHGHVKAHFPLAYGFPNAAAVGVFRRIGYCEVGQMVRHALVLRHRRYVERIVPAPQVARAAGAVLDGVARARQVLRAAPALLRRRLVWLPDVDERFDELWETVYRGYPLIGFRGRRFVRWRFLDKPAERFEIAALFARGPGEDRGRLLAYAVVQVEARTAHVRDVLGASEAEVGALLDHLVLALQRRDLDSVSVRFLGAPGLRRVLAARGVAPRPGGRSVIAEMGALPDPLAALLRDPDNWYVTDADEDV